MWSLIAVMRFVTLFLALIACCNTAHAGSHGHARVASPRSEFNLGTYSQFDYAFINFFLEGDSFLSPVGTNFATGTCYWQTILDSNGWPNNACANGLTFGGGVRLPSSAQFSGQYTLDGSGLGVMVLGIGTQFTLSTGVQCGGVASGTAPNTSGSGWGYSSAVNGTITTNDSAGTGFCVPFTNVGQSTPQLSNFHVTNTCSTTSGACAGAFVKNVRLYQQRDYTRLAAGNVFRTEYLQPIATLDPSYIRTMQWGPGNGSRGQIRYENRPKVTTTSGSSGAYWLSSRPYTVSSGTNLLSVAAVTGTPASMTHGEIATFRVGNTMNKANCIGGGCPYILSVANGSGGEIQTSSAHGFTTGDVVIHHLSGASIASMPNLNLYPVCVTVIDTTHYTMQKFTVATNTCTATNVDTTTWGSYVVNTSSFAVEYASLNVGNRLNAPLVTNDGVRPAMETGFAAGAGSYLIDLVFDKNSCAITDGASNLICGAWLTSSGLENPLCPNAGDGCGFEATTPIELMVELVNEVNALLVGGQNPVGLWINLPHMGLLPTDPDYSTASDYPLNEAKTIINGAYPLCSGCPLIIEDGNEWWNNGYPDDAYFSRQNFLRYGVSGSTDFGTLRSVQMFEDIHNNSGVYNPSIFYFALMGGPPGAVGNPLSSGSGNYDRIFGDATIMGDVRWPNSASPPYAYFDYIGFAPYVNAPSTFYTANFSTMESAWCTAESTACAATPPYAPNCTGTVDTTYCQPFVAGIAGPPIVDNNDLSTVADAMVFDAEFEKAASMTGKSYVNYEGAANWQTHVGSHNPDGSAISTLAQSNYLIALYQSQSWANLWTSYCQARLFNTSAGGCGNLQEISSPADSFVFDAGASPDTFGAGSTEGAFLIPLWFSLGTMNAGQP